jgi:polyvinyl alcohol dehydrogenase (cytochrome)
MKHWKNVLKVGFGLAILLVAIAGGLRLYHGSTRNAQASSGSGDWPTFLGDVGRSATNLNETTITASTAQNLHYSWKFTTGGDLVASPTIVAGVMYIGSWDGNEYAINLTTHQQIWKQFLGITQQNQFCYAKTVGVSSTAAVQNGVVYVGGGDGNFYALNASDGSVIWKTFLGAPPYYNWSSPLLYGNKVYEGLAAYCDPPYVKGKVVAMWTTDGTFAAVADLVPKNQKGATVTSSLAVDTVANRIYATTGNPAPVGKLETQQPNSQAFLAFDPTTLAIVDSWQIPASQAINDSDFLATPTLFDVNGVGYIGALNKNGMYYVLNRLNLAAGPVWEYALSNSSKTVGDNASSSCYNNGVIYAASGGETLNGVIYGGSVVAFDATTGSVLWSVHMLGPTVAPVTCTSDLVIDNQGQTVEVRDAATGALLFQHTTLKKLWGASLISNGTLYTPSRDGSLYAFTLK